MLQCEKWMLGKMWGTGENHVNVTSFAALRIQLSNRSSDPETPVPCLGNIMLVAKPKHQLVTGLCILR